MRLWPLISIFFPSYVLGFGLSLDAKSDHGQVLVVHREQARTTLTVFSAEPTTRWMVLLPNKDTSVRIVPREALINLDRYTRPVLEHQVENDPCGPPLGTEEPERFKPLAVPTQVIKVQPKTLNSPAKNQISTDLQIALDEGWHLAELTTPKGNPGIQITWESEQIELPPRPTREGSDVGELTFITLAEKRLEPVNFKNQVVVTNVHVKDVTIDAEALVSSMFAASNVIEKGAFYTEFARSCEPGLCVDTAAFGGPTAVITRMKRITDLAKFTGPVTLYPTFHLEGGIDGTDGTLRAGGYSADRSNFQMRLVARTPFKEPVRCVSPVYGQWKSLEIKTIRGIHNPDTTVEQRAALFADTLVQDVPEIFWSQPSPAEPGPEVAKPAEVPPTKTSSCGGCSPAFALFMMPFAWRRRRNSGESA